MAEGLVLVNVFTPHQIEQAGICRDAQEIDYLFEGKLMLSYTSNQDIRALWNLYQNHHYGMAAREDVLWSGKQHSISVAYDRLTNVTGRTSTVWHKVIWSISSPARDNLMMWKVIKNALLTKNKLLSYGMNVDPMCVYCKLQVESVTHLFFGCNELLGLWGRLVRRIAEDHKHCLSELE